MLTATILSTAPLPLPSASGVEIVNDTAYVVSDDAPFLYPFRAADLAPGEPLRLFEPEKLKAGRIPKKHKPDLEAIALLPAGAAGPAGLLLAGSGARPTRETGYWVAFDGAGRPAAPAAVSLAALYDALREHLPAGQKLNIEALATTDTHLLLFQRSVGTVAGRCCFRLPLAEARALLGAAAGADTESVAPTIEMAPYAVPDLDGQPGGLSGATIHAGRLLVTVSVEITDDPVCDGQIVGSFVGLFDPDDLTTGAFAHLVWPDGRPFREKVEGLAVRAHTAAGYELLLVTDDDQGHSTALVVALVVGH